MAPSRPPKGQRASELIPPRITRKKYADFELTGEWKISKGGNSGILLRVADMESEEWKARLAGSKFAKSEHFNKKPTGHIALQNYRGAGVWFRKLRIREIESEE